MNGKSLSFFFFFTWNESLLKAMFKNQKLSVPITFQHHERITTEDLTSSTSCKFLITEDVERNVFVNALNEPNLDQLRAVGRNGKCGLQILLNGLVIVFSSKPLVFSVTKHN